MFNQEVFTLDYSQLKKLSRLHMNKHGFKIDTERFFSITTEGSHHAITTIIDSSTYTIWL